MKRRTVISIVAALALLISVCSCAFAEVQSADGVAAQTDLLYAYLTALNVETEEQHYLYTVTDLDGNGRLELIAASELTNDYVTYGVIVEADEGFETATVVDLAEGVTMPEILVSHVTAYTAEDGSVSYVFSDAREDGDTMLGVALKEGVLSAEKIAERSIEVLNGVYASTYKNAAGDLLDPIGYDKVAEDFFNGAAKSVVNFDWFTLAEAERAQRLTDSYAVFTGEKEPAADADAKLEDEKMKNVLSATPLAPAAEEATTEAAPETAEAPATAEGGIVIVDENGNPTGQTAEDVLGENFGKTGDDKKAEAQEDNLQIVTVDPDKQQNTKTGDGKTTADGYQIYDSIEEARAAIGNSNYSPKTSGKTSGNSGVTIVDAPKDTPEYNNPVVPDPVVVYDGGSAGSGAFTSSTGTALNLTASYDSRVISDSQVQVTVSATLSHATLSSRSTSVSYALGGQSGYGSAPAIDSNGGSTYLGSYTFTVNLPAGQSTALNCSASWTFNGTYSGTYIGAVTASGTVYLSR